MFPREIRLPAGNGYLPGNSPNYLQLTDAYHVEKFEKDLSLKKLKRKKKSSLSSRQPKISILDNVSFISV